MLEMPENRGSKALRAGCLIHMDARIVHKRMSSIACCAHLMCHPQFQTLTPYAEDTPWRSVCRETPSKCGAATQYRIWCNGANGSNRSTGERTQLI